MRLRLRRLVRWLGAAFILLLAAPAKADNSSVPMIGWQKSERDYPYSAFWNGTAWTGTVSGRNSYNEAVWMVLRNCPTRDEYVMGSLDWNYDVNIQFFRLGSWDGLTEVTSNAGGWSTRAFDLAYEQRSGDLLAVYWRENAPSGFRYRTSSGGGLSSEQTLNLPENFRIYWVKMLPRPDSDQILLLAINGPLDLYATWWDGSSFGPVTTLHDNCSYSTTECFDAAFESQSGDLLVVYTSNGNQQPRYRLWNGASWSAAGSLPSVGSNQRWLRLAADPASDQILFACSDDARDLNTNVWNGSSWGTNQELATEVSWTQLRAFDLAYENGGGRALIVHSRDWENRFRYRIWNGNTWSSEQTGANLGDPVIIPQLTTGLNPGEIFVGIQDDGNDLNAMLWTGSDFTANQRVEATQSAWGQECFMIAVPQGASQLFTEVSAATGFGATSSNDPDWGSGLHWGDLNGDGYLDALVTGNASSRLLLNGGAGAFSITTFGGGSVYRQGALVDIDNDGDLDFWGIPGYWADEKLFLNNGSASFTDGGTAGFPDPWGNESVAAADVNGDGRADVLMFAENGNWIAHNQGRTPPALSSTISATYGLNDPGDVGNGDFCSAGDVNNDGCLDFFHHYDVGRLYLSDGDGTYTHNNAGLSVVTGDSSKIGSSWGDYDNDGDLDLFVPRYAAGSTGYLWRNQLAQTGTVSFTDVAAAAGLTDASGQRGGCWGDYDNDGDLDLYVVTRGGAANVLYQNQGPPNWNFVAVNVGAAAPGDGQDAVFVDYDNDGDLDLAVTQTGAANTLLRNNTNNANYLKVRVVGGGACGTNAAGVGVGVELWNSAGTTFLARREIGVARGFGGAEPMWVHFGGVINTQTYLVKVRFVGGWAATTVVPNVTTTTINGTVIPQMLTVTEQQTQVVFTDVSAAAGFGVASSNSTEWGSGLHWGDLNGDGHLDAIITGNASSRLLINNAAGTFTVTTFGGGSIYRQGALLDIDDDGDLDFWGTPTWQDERLFLNNGAASFTNAGACGFSAPNNNEGLAAADVNSDGLTDVVMFSENGNWIGHNQGGNPPVLSGTNAASYGMNDSGNVGNGDYCSSGDVNNDGRPDFFYHYSSGKLFISDGDGTYTHHNHGIAVVTGLSAKVGSAWGDYDNDGDLDLFVCRYASGQTGYLWRNDVNWTTSIGSFTNVTAAAGITDTSGQTGCCWGDYDNDGDLDLYVVTRGGAANVLYRNQGDGTFVAACAGADAPGDGQDAVFVDYDNDGDLDLAVTQTGATNTLLRNNTDNLNYLHVRVVGRGAGGTNKAGLGTRVELWNAAGTTRLARRDIGGARGFGGAEPLWAHFGGVDRTSAYLVKTYFPSLPVSEPHAVSVTPQAAATTIGGTTIPQMLTIEEPTASRVVNWREVPRKP